MWFRVSHIILKYRIPLIIVMALITAFMGYRSQFAQLSYDFTSAVPSDDEDMVYYQRFKKVFGDDGTLLVMGFKSSQAYELGGFKALEQLTQDVEALNGVREVISMPQMQYLERDTVSKRFEARPIFSDLQNLEDQKRLDSLIAFAQNQKFYEKILFNQESKAISILILLERDAIESARRQSLIQEIQDLGSAFSQKIDSEVHYAGIPFVRSIVAGQVASELKFLLILSGVATGLILFLFFGSLVSVIFPLIIIGTVVLWSVGYLTFFGFKITILTGLLPPVLVVIGVPNCVYLLNKYHQEYRIHQNQAKALARIIRKIGVVTLMTNTTTAIGFAVFIFMDNQNLREFGIISSLSIMTTFLVSIILLPAFYSLIPPPSEKQLRHLDRKPLNRLLDVLHYLVFNQRTATYIVVVFISIFSLIGFLQIRVNSFMVDNLPAESQPKLDLAFFERQFVGVMPLEIVVNTNRPKGASQENNLKQVENFIRSLDEVSLVSPPISLLSLVKASRQAFYNNDPEYYGLPSRREAPFILRYLQGGQDSTSNVFLSTLVDSSGQNMRISLKVADVGSEKLDSLVHQVIEPKLAASFKDPRTEAKVTGTTLIFLKGNDYLVSSLKNSLALAIVLIALLMAVLFGSFRMILVSLLSNLLPLLFTAGLMGYFEISLKPSTALVFSIAFGIAIDDSIHFLARYRQELLARNFSLNEAIAVSLRETGTGMIYTSIILFFGFIVFVYSTFEGTIALGVLTSLTLFCAMLANLILLPSLLLTFGPGRYRRHTSQLIELYDESGIYEDDDEEIDLDLIRVRKNPDEITEEN